MSALFYTLCYSDCIKQRGSNMDANTIAPIMGIILMVIALGFVLFGVVGMLDWYGAINVPWMNVDRKSSSEADNRNE